jgi:hypothetical protein
MVVVCRATGVAVGAGVGVAAGVGLGVAVGAGVDVAAGVGLGVAAGVGVGVAAGVGRGVAVGIGDGSDAGGVGPGAVPLGCVPAEFTLVDPNTVVGANPPIPQPVKRQPALTSASATLTLF